jgi:hypothetical protein
LTQTASYHEATWLGNSDVQQDGAISRGTNLGARNRHGAARTLRAQRQLTLNAQQKRVATHEVIESPADAWKLETLKRVHL